MNFDQDFSDFTISNYKKLLASAKEFYLFTLFDKIDWDAKFMLWRHDVDFSIEASLVLAKIENLLGIQATYFINLHSEFYNPLQASQAEIVHQIKALNHDVGIHFDMDFYNVVNEIELSRRLDLEISIFRETFELEPSVFSFHNPTADHLKFDNDMYCGLINTYSKTFKNVPYCSDSNGYWRHEKLSDFIKNETYKNAQVLTHPGWWQEEPNPPRLRIANCAYNRASNTLSIYDGVLNSGQRENIDFIDVSLREITNYLQLPVQTLDFLILQGEYDLVFKWISEKVLSQKSLVQKNGQLTSIIKNMNKIETLEELNDLGPKLLTIINIDRTDKLYDHYK